MLLRKIKRVSNWILLLMVTSLLLIEHTRNCEKQVNIGRNYGERKFVESYHNHVKTRTMKMLSNQTQIQNYLSLPKDFNIYNAKLPNDMKALTLKSKRTEITTTDDKSIFASEATLIELKLNNTAQAKPTSIQDYNEMTCKELMEGIEKARLNLNYQFRKENTDGNRGICFAKFTNQKGELINAVIKQATLKNESFESEVYRYRSAIREIENLRKLRALSWKGVPDLLGSCITPTEVTYVVTLIPGVPICREGNGNDQECSMGREMKKTLKANSNPELATLTWISKVACFFKQFEEHRVFMEDISGVNLFVIPNSFDIYIVDADSMLFYGDVSISSRSSCRTDQECHRPSGNFWSPKALNHKIYYTCREMMGYCVNNRCRGYDASLHACGIARWLISPMRASVPDRFYNDFRHIMHCLMAEEPTIRCTMAESCVKANEILKKYSTSQT